MFQCEVSFSNFVICILLLIKIKNIMRAMEKREREREINREKRKGDNTFSTIREEANGKSLYFFWSAKRSISSMFSAVKYRHQRY